MCVCSAPTLWVAVGASGFVGLAAILFLTTGNATVQLASDPHYRGRVMALWSTALVGSAPIGAPIVGAVSEALDPRAAIALGALACVAAGAVSLVSPGSVTAAQIGGSIQRRFRFPRRCIPRSGEPRLPRSVPTW